jgi:hypothetical protein
MGCHQSGDPTVQTALELAVRLIDALSAGLTCDYLLSSWYPPPYWESAKDNAFPLEEIVAATFEVEAYRKLTASLARINARSSPLFMRTLHF